MKTHQNTNETALFSIEEACHFLGIGKTKLWQLRKVHKIPEVRLLGRNPRFLRADLEDLIAKTRTITTFLLLMALPVRIKRTTCGLGIP